MASKVTVRVRTAAKMYRVTLTPQSTFSDLKRALSASNLAGVPSSSMTISLDPAGRHAAMDSQSLSEVGIAHGTIVFMTSTAVSAPAARTSAGAPVAGGAGIGAGAGAASLGATGGSTAAAASTVDLSATQRARLGLPSVVSKATKGEEIEWLCTHPPHQMCTNCAPLHKGDAVKLEMLCQHGPEGKCVNCLPSDKVTDRKHLSYKEYLLKRKAKCEHSPSAVCVNCTPPADVSYLIKPGCINHKPYPQGLCSVCQPPQATLARQVYRHVDYTAIVGFNDMARLVNLWTATGMAMQRAAIMYGRYEADPNVPSGCKAVMECMYEPPQKTNGTDVTLLEDPFASKADRIAGALGMSRIGWVFTHKPRSYVLSSSDVRQMARLQNAHRTKEYPGSRFVTLAISQNAAGEIEPSAFMASDQAMAMERCKLFTDSKNPEAMQARKGKKGEYLPSIIRNDAKLGAQEVTQFEPEFLIVQVNSGQPRVPVKPVLLRSEFPIENRGDFGETQTSGHFVSLLKRFRTGGFKDALSDFHALLYVAKSYDMETAIACTEAVRVGVALPEGVQLMFSSLV